MFSPRKPKVKGSDLENIFSLREGTDANKINANSQGKNVVIIGAGFIGNMTNKI